MFKIFNSLKNNKNTTTQATKRTFYIETKEEVHTVHCIYIRIANVNVNTDNLFYKCFDFKTKMLSHFLFVDFELNKPFLNISEDQKNLYIQSTVKKWI